MPNMETTVASHTHSSPDKLSKEQIHQELTDIKYRLISQFESEPQKLQELLGVLNELSEFEMGRFLIKNNCAFSGYWTWYLIMGFKGKEITSPLEKFILEKVPMVLSTRERFNLFQSLIFKHIKSNSRVCSVPCGMMADLLTLKLPKDIQNVQFIGSDLDGEVFSLAKNLQKQLQCPVPCEFYQESAWQLSEHRQYDIITSNGLNVYEKDDNKVVDLYRSFYRALKSNGKLISSVHTHPPGGAEPSEWNVDIINQDDLALQATIYKTLLDASWANFRSSKKTIEQLKAAGFDSVEIHWDSQRISPTFCATKLGNSL